MARIRVPLSNFQFGEVSPSMLSRTDTKIYPNAAKKVKNFFLRNEGGLLKRFGTRKIYEFDTTVNTSKRQQIRIIPFIFSDDERYIIALENLKIRCFKIDPSTGAISLVETITQDTASAALPITDSILDEITYAQSGDVMFLCHQTFMIRKLTRTSLNDFEVSTYAFATDTDQNNIFQPYYSFHGLDVTLDPSKTSGTGATLTTSVNYWDTTGSQTGGNYLSSKHIGLTIRYHGQEIEIKSVQSATQATGDIVDKLEVHLDTDAIETTDGTADIQITMALHGLSTSDSITISDAGGVGGITASNINGTRTVQEIVNENVFIVTAGANANANAVGGGSPKIETHAPTTQWEEQSYSALRGFPAAVTFHENRLWFGGTLSQPDGIWASRSGLYFNFDVGDAEDDDALDLTASIGEINTVRHIVSNRDLQIFTNTSELYIPAFTDKPITPTNAQIRRQTPYGASFVRPQSLDGATVYVQKNGSVVREYIYSDAEAAYVSTSISQISAHLINDPVQMSILRGAINRPESYAFFLNQDGTLAIFTSNRGEQRAGWAQFTTNGKFHSICTVDERVFLVGQYDKGDGTNKFILTEFDSSLELDFSEDFTGSAGVFDVSSHFANGAVVDVVNGDDYLGQFTVASGNVDVSAVQAITAAEIGLKFDVEAETLPIDAQIQGGPLTGNPRRVNRVILDLVSTLSVSVNDKPLVIRQVTDDLSAGRTAVTEKKEFRLLGYSKDPTVRITQSAPLSLQINGLIAEVSF
jgi:hypothetical protein|tara:strand:+ start:5632 stop:7896 length:2265 start_codon:yes stop_codon:yes gene_type:complete